MPCCLGSTIQGCGHSRNCPDPYYKSGQYLIDEHMDYLARDFCKKAAALYKEVGYGEMNLFMKDSLKNAFTKGFEEGASFRFTTTPNKGTKTEGKE